MNSFPHPRISSHEGALSTVFKAGRDRRSRALGLTSPVSRGGPLPGASGPRPNEAGAYRMREVARPGTGSGHVPLPPPGMQAERGQKSPGAGGRSRPTTVRQKADGTTIFAWRFGPRTTPRPSGSPEVADARLFGAVKSLVLYRSAVHPEGRRGGGCEK